MGFTGAIIFHSTYMQQTLDNPSIRDLVTVPKGPNISKVGVLLCKMQ